MGFVVGLVDRPKILDGTKVRPGDVLVGLPSNGLHTNGYSLARRVVFDRLGLSIDDPIPDIEPQRTAGEWLLDVHKTYLPAIRPLLGRPELHALAHITGGGLTDNVPRSLPDGCRAVVDTGSWRVPEPFRAIERYGGVTRTEMLRVFNMGVGMVLVVDREGLEIVLAALKDGGEEPFVLGEVVPGDGGVEYAEGPS